MVILHLAVTVKSGAVMTKCRMESRQAKVALRLGRGRQDLPLKGRPQGHGSASRRHHLSRIFVRSWAAGTPAAQREPEYAHLQQPSEGLLYQHHQ